MVPQAAFQQSEKSLREVEIEKIRLNPFQPRKEFTRREIQELAASIRSVGLLHPPLVRLAEEGVYELISGERRLRASQEAGLERIPVLVITSSDTHSAHAALIENVQRVDLNAMEVAYALQRLIDEFAYTQDELARRIGKKRSTVANYLRLLTLPSEVKESVARGEISMGHAKVVLSLTDRQSQLELLNRIRRDRLTVRGAEQERRDEDLHAADLARRLGLKFGRKVSLTTKRKGGTLSLEFYSLDDLDRLLEDLGL
jgi:ParB family transcriptional regulator, chromosome partitioning protein